MKNLHTLVTYGCHAHWLNLLGQDLTPTQVMKHVTDVNRQGLQLRELTTRAHDGPIMNVSKPASSRYIKSVAYRGPTTWNRLKPELRCLRDKNRFVSAIKCYFWETYRTLNIG